jgi:hypothetical protein
MKTSLRVEKKEKIIGVGFYSLSSPISKNNSLILVKRKSYSFVKNI